MIQTYTLLDRDQILDSEPHYILRIRDLPVEDKPREKLIRFGPKGLTAAELMAILLGVGTRKEEVFIMAQRILKEYGEKTIVNETNVHHLSQALEIPLVKSCQIVASFELGRRFFAKREGRAVYIRSAKQAYSYLKGMSELKKEQLRGLYLNSRYEVVQDEIVSLGSLTANIVHPREVFRPAIEHGAVALILAHNHPSGSLRPTPSDIEVTHQIVEAGQILGIDVLDHLIIANQKFLSIMEGINSHDNIYNPSLPTHQ